MKINSKSEIGTVEKVEMKLGPADIKVGMMATHYIGSDSYAMVIIGHPTKQSIEVDFYDASRHGNIIKDKFTGIEHVQMITDRPLNPRIYTYRKKSAIWVEKGSYGWGHGGLAIGYGVDYRDPNF